MWSGRTPARCSRQARLSKIFSRSCPIAMMASRLQAPLLARLAAVFDLDAQACELVADRVAGGEVLLGAGVVAQPQQERDESIEGAGVRAGGRVVEDRDDASEAKEDGVGELGG